MFGKQDVLEKLRDDDLYYGDYGQQWLSASTLKKYIKGDCPKEDNYNSHALLFGHAFHQAILEPDKYVLRNDITKDDREHIDMLKSSLESSFEYHVMEDITEVEVPFTGTFDGTPLKCKVDALTDRYLVDLKTTSNIDAVEFTAKHFGYHISAYQYWMLTRKVMYFLYVEKKTGRVKLVMPDKKFYEDGRRDFLWCLRNYKLAQKKYWQLMLFDTDLPDGRFLLDDVNMKVEDGKLYSYILKEEYIKRKR